MSDVQGGGFRPISRRVELYDYTAFSAPTATLTDTSAEEIEIDQGLSLQGRRLGGVPPWWITEELKKRA